MEYSPAPFPYVKRKNEARVIKSEEYELNLGEESFSLLIGINSNDKIFLKLKNKQNLLLYDYTKEYKYDEIRDLLLLHEAQYKDLSKIMLYFKKAIENRKLELIYNEENKKMIIRVTKVADFEELKIPIELNEKKLSNEEMFQILFEEINSIKNSNNKKREDEDESNKNEEIIKELKNKNEENEKYIKSLENKISILQNEINSIKNNIKEKYIQYININDFSNFKDNTNKKIDEQIKSINSLKKYVEEKICENSNSLNNFIIDLNEKIKDNTNLINNIKSNIEDMMSENMKIVQEKINNNLKRINNFESLQSQMAQKYLLFIEKTISEQKMQNKFNMNNINNNMNNMNNMNNFNNMNNINNINDINNMNNMNNVNNPRNINNKNNMKSITNINSMNNMNQMNNNSMNNNFIPENMNNINDNRNNLLHSVNPMMYSNQMNDFQKNNLLPVMTVNFHEYNVNMNLNKAISIQCLSEDVLENVIKKYKKKSGNNGKMLRFFCNNRELTNLKLTISQIGINNEKDININVF